MSATKLAGRIPSLIDFMGQRSFAGSPAHGGFVELREYTLHPRGIAPFLKLTTETADLRKRLLPFLG